jgi:hypothetical protein
MGNYIWWARGPVLIAPCDEPAALWRFKAAARAWTDDVHGHVDAVQGAPSLDDALDAIIWSVCRDSEGRIVAIDLPFDVKDSWAPLLEQSIEALEFTAPGSHVMMCNEGYGKPFTYVVKTGISSCEGCEQPSDDEPHMALAAAHTALSLVEEVLRERPDVVPGDVRRWVEFALVAIRTHVFQRRASPSCAALRD